MRMRIKTREAIEATFTRVDDENYTDRCRFPSTMFQYCGTVVEASLITGYNDSSNLSDRYKVDNNHWTWVSDWLEPDKTIYLGGE